VNDLDLLRQFEPILRFTEGELFFPCAVEGYVRRASLLLRTRDRDAPPIVPSGDLDLDGLVRESDADPERALCLRLVQEPLKGLAYHQWQRRKDRPVFHTAGRLARVGLLARFIDSLFTLSLLLRGTTPGGTAAAAEQAYRAQFEQTPEFVYHGRVVRQGPYVVLNYLFFYYMNDWRSTFDGVNDHEADWEQIFVYLAERDGSYEPAWLAYASHDYQGDDLRRRWDDPALTIAGTHPVVFPGAGSHSSYFYAGEYLTSVEIPYVRPLLDGIALVRRFWREVLRQGEPGVVAQIEGLLHIPFVDYARGDGLAIGPGQGHEWAPALISDETPWVQSYRGLWGLDTHDPMRGELAPSGPKYQRDGSVRQTWYDPLGWAGLGKVAPPAQAAPTLESRISELEREQSEIDGQLAEIGATLPGMELEIRSLRGDSYLAELTARRGQELSAEEAKRDSLEARRVEVSEALGACRRLLKQLEAGEMGDPEAHLHYKRMPQSPQELHESKLAELWAGLSIVILLLGGVSVLVLERENWLIALVLLVGAVVVVENIFRRSLQQLLLNATIALAAISTLVLIYSFFWTLSLLVVVAIALVILRDNLRELRGL
jgi:hypothetical protein